MTAPARITFVGWQLGPYGGLETRIATALDLARQAGHASRVQLARPLPPGSPSDIALRAHEVQSVADTWGSRRTVRFSQQVWRAAASLRQRRLLSQQEARQFGHRWLMSEIGQYWEHDGALLLAETDLLHLFGPPLPFVVDAMRAAHAAGVPTLYQAVHSVTAEYAHHPLRSGFTDDCNMLDLVLLNFEAQAAHFREHFHYEGPVVTLGQWAYDIESELLAIDRPSSSTLPLTIGTLCRFDRVKGLDTLIRGFAMVADSLPVVLRIGGDGPEALMLQELVHSLGLDGKVEFVGRVDDRVAFYRSIDIFAVTSHAEGGPVTGVEAMAAGLPIVSTRVGAMPERLDQGGGHLINVGDTDALSAALRDLASNPGLRFECGGQARQRYLEGFTAAIQSRRLLDAWDGLLAGGNSR